MSELSVAKMTWRHMTNVFISSCFISATYQCHVGSLNDDRSNDIPSNWRTKMENSSTTNFTANNQNTDQNKQTVRKEICAKWSKFSEQDVSAFKSKADLVSQVVSKYGLSQVQAQTDVDALLKGRSFGAGA
jgi:hypothetical protein